jgi:nitrite reductase (NADH) small subunit
MKMTGWVRLTKCENIPLREGRAIQIDGHEIAIFNLGGRFLATENRCPHRGGPLADGIVSGQTVVCPLHSRKVCLQTGEMEGIATSPLCAQTYPTRIADGHVDLKFPAPLQEEDALRSRTFFRETVEVRLPQGTL